MIIFQLREGPTSMCVCVEGGGDYLIKQQG